MPTSAQSRCLPRTYAWQPGVVADEHRAEARAAVRAHAGIDVGATLIGMHLKPVAVPVRPPRPFVGHAFVTMAVTRPRLIGGPRARYPEYRR
ncbi:MAG: DUF436 family protein [Brockia lithotrophica]|nr:DUF436 family protein [Brockia lithotrophica]